MSMKKVICFVLFSLLIAGIFIPTSEAFATTSEMSVFQKLSENEKTYVDYLAKEVEKFLEIDEQGKAWFNEEAARENGAKSDVLDVGIVYNSLVFRGWDPTSPTHYGNWCGAGNKNGGPIDVLDYYCFKHDKCYENHGYGNKTCDMDFVSNLKANLSRIKNLGTAAYYYALAAIKLFG